MYLSITDFLKYLVLGLIQGVTEPLPISSSGHLMIFKNVFNVYIENDINFTIIVNFASFIAIVLYYRLFLKDIIIGAWNYIFKKDPNGKKDFLYILFVGIATIPAGIAGILLMDTIDKHLSSLMTVGFALLLTSILLFIIHQASKKASNENITLKTSILMGFAQVLGLLPGISRSGVTTSLAVLNKTKVEKALRFSFMMYIPISIASMILGISQIDPTTTYIPGYIIAFIASLIGTYFALKIFFKLVKKDNLKYFGYYCLLVSTFVLVYVFLIK